MGGKIAARLVGPAKKQMSNTQTTAQAALLRQVIPNPSNIIASGLDGIRIAGGWGAPSANIAAETVDVRQPGRPVVRLTLNSGASPAEVSARVKVYPRAVTGKIELWVKMPKVSAGSVYMGVATSSDTPANDPPNGRSANYRRIVLTTGMFNPGEWTCLTIDRSGYVFAQPGTTAGITWSVTGTPDITKIEYLEVFFGSDSNVPNAERTMLIDQVAINGKAKPIVMFGFDGFNLTSHQTIVKPLFDKLGIKGYIAGDGDAIASVRSFLADRYAQGWDIVSSGMYHRNYANEPSFLSPEYDQCRALLDAEGFTRASRFFVYPNTARTDATDAILAAKGVIMSRTPGGPPNVISTLGLPNLMKINTYDWGLQSLATIQLWRDTAINAGEWLSPLNHTIKTGMTVSTDTERATFEQVVKEIVALRDAGVVDIFTPTEAVASLGYNLSA
jgi:hypothetical protein